MVLFVFFATLKFIKFSNQIFRVQMDRNLSQTTFQRTDTKEYDEGMTAFTKACRGATIEVISLLSHRLFGLVVPLPIAFCLVGPCIRRSKSSTL